MKKFSAVSDCGAGSGPAPMNDAIFKFLFFPFDANPDHDSQAFAIGPFILSCNAAAEIDRRNEAVGSRRMGGA
jgi:hypothetical protein